MRKALQPAPNWVAISPTAVSWNFDCPTCGAACQWTNYGPHQSFSHAAGDTNGEVPAECEPAIDAICAREVNRQLGKAP